MNIAGGLQAGRAGIAGEGLQARRAGIAGEELQPGG